MFLICYVILKDHMFKELWDFLSRRFSQQVNSCGFMGRNHLMYVTTRKHCGSGDVMVLVYYVILKDRW